MADPGPVPRFRDTFPALASLAEFGGGMQPGHLSVHSHAIRFESKGRTVEWPLAEVQVQLGGHDGRQIFLSRVGQPQSCISTGDFSVLDHEVLRFGPLQEQVARLRQQSKALPIGWLVCGGLFLVLVLGVVGLFLQKGRLSRSLAAQVPLAWETQLGESIYAQVSRTSTLLTNHVAFNNQLRVVTNALLPAIRDSAILFQFHIVEDTNLNAFAVPGGQVFINTGLLQAVKRPEELAGVLAHEVAHVTRRHGLRKVIENAGMSLLIRALLGDAEGLLAAAGNTSQFLLNQSFSRDFEREADEVGWDYLVSAGIDPRGMIDFFETMKREQEKSSTGRAANLFPILSTHPATDERMERLQKRWNATPNKGGFRPLPSVLERGL
jgi:Zn-dependent protease with chaperone function